jgi:hypothetical protein
MATSVRTAAAADRFTTPKSLALLWFKVFSFRLSLGYPTEIKPYARPFFNPCPGMISWPPQASLRCRTRERGSASIISREADFAQKAPNSSLASHGRLV